MEVRVEYQLTRSEYVGAVCRAAFGRRGFWFSELLMATAIVAGVAVPADRALAGLGVVLVLWGPVSVAVAARRTWKRRSGTFGASQVVRFTEDGVDIETPVRSAMYKWGAFTGCKTAGDLYLLSMRGGGFLIVPRRGFVGDQDVEQFKLLMARGLAAAPLSPQGLPASSEQRDAPQPVVPSPRRRAHLIAPLVAAIAIAAAVGLGVSLGGTHRSQFYGNFAGYSWFGKVTSVQGAWIVPRILPGSPLDADAGSWISVQAPGNSSPFIQIGTNEWDDFPRQDPQPDYFAFWSDTKRHYLDQPLFDVAPGDVVTATLRLADGTWTLSILDETSGIRRRFTTREDAKGSFNDASWLEEHVVGRRGNFGYPRLSAVAFTALRLNAHAPGQLCPAWMSEHGKTLVPQRQGAASFVLRTITVSGPAPAC